VCMREKVIRLMTLSSLGILFLVTVAASSSLTIMDKCYTQQTFQDASTLKGLSIEPMGCPGSGKGQGPVLVSSLSPFSANTPSVC